VCPCFVDKQIEVDHRRTSLRLLNAYVCRGGALALALEKRYVRPQKKKHAPGPSVVSTRTRGAGKWKGSLDELRGPKSAATPCLLEAGALLVR
jgi:hypothetical protein